MRRRAFLVLLGAAALPRMARAQRPDLPVVGWISSRSPADTAHLVSAFRRGLGEEGIVEGRDVLVEYRWALGQYDRLPGLAAELVARAVKVIAAAARCSWIRSPSAPAC